MGDSEFRSKVMEALQSLVDGGVDRLTTKELENFVIEGTPWKLLHHRGGIWNPQELDATLSVISDPTGPYPDREISDGVWEYAYQRGSVDGKNAKLRKAMDLKAPIVLFRRIADGVYVPLFPVYVIADDPGRRIFTLAVREAMLVTAAPDVDSRRYVESLVRKRVHQREFRGKVMLAYQDQCAICRLKHRELLDAAHIIGDSKEFGEPVVPNGLSLCKIHHAAFDQNLLGIDPNYVVHVDVDLLNETDGPMLKHGLQAMHGARLQVPRQVSQRPDRERLEIRFAGFSAA